MTDKQLAEKIAIARATCIATIERVLNESAEGEGSGGWVSVKDALPDEDEEVIAIIPMSLSPDEEPRDGFCYEIGRRNYEAATGWWLDGKSDGRKVTHWMPLPLPPEHPSKVAPAHRKQQSATPSERTYIPLTPDCPDGDPNCWLCKLRDRHLPHNEQPIAECLICGYVKPLGVWKSGSAVGVCVECRDRARGESPQAAVALPPDPTLPVEQINQLSSGSDGSAVKDDRPYRRGMMPSTPLTEKQRDEQLTIWRALNDARASTDEGVAAHEGCLRSYSGVSDPADPTG